MGLLQEGEGGGNAVVEAEGDSAVEKERVAAEGEVAEEEPKRM